MSRSLLAFTIFLSLILLAAAHGGNHDDDQGGEEEDEGSPHDLRSKPLVLVKIWCLIIIFAGTFVGGVSPYFLKWNEVFLVLGTQFAGGVFLGTALMHFLSDANETFGDLTSKEYPFAFMLACAGYLVTMLADCVISYVFAKKRDGFNGDLELQGGLVQGKISHHETASQVSSQVGNGKDASSSKFSLAAASSLGDSILLIVALCFHSVFEGIAIGVAETQADAWKALWTISPIRGMEWKNILNNFFFISHAFTLCMPPSSSRLIFNGLSLSQFQKFIPKKWKQPISDEARSMQLTPLEVLRDCATRGNLLKAVEVFSRIPLNAASRDVALDSIASVISCCGKAKALAQGKQLHACALALGFEKNPVLVPKLVTLYSSFGLYDGARFIVENCNIFHPLPWNLLISSYVRDGLYAEALCAYKQMASKGIRADIYTYPSVLKACGETLDMGFGKDIHRCIDACKEWSLFVHNALISMYGKFGEIDIARRLFDEMSDRDGVSWNTMISIYSSKGSWEEAFQLFVKMQEAGVEVNVITWNTIAGAYLRTGNFKGALKLLSRMRTQDVYFDSVATVIGLKACSHMGALKLGREIHGSAVRGCYGEYENVRNALINMYSRCEDLRQAYVLFQMTAGKSIITWNSMLSGFTHLDRAEEAAFLFREMLGSGFEPNCVTIASILPLCARVANLKHGREFHCYILRRAVFHDHLMLWNSLVEMYARSGKVLEAKRVFDLMSRRDEVTYTSLIGGYGIQGEGQVALKLFDEMNKCGIKPDHVTMVAVLSACSHSGMVVEGQKQFERMASVHGICAQLEHFDCMVDLYGRAGLLNKAKEIVTSMPCAPTSALWATLLGACHIHRNTNIGVWAAEKLLETRPENSGYYVLVANMYASAGCWDKLAKVRTIMRDLGVTKAPGCTWVDTGNRVSPFLVDDTSNLQAQEIYPLLDGLTELMKDAGYVAEKDCSSEDEVIEEIG